MRDAHLVLLGLLFRFRLSGFLFLGRFFLFILRRSRRWLSRGFAFVLLGRRRDERGILVEVHFLGALDRAHRLENVVRNVVGNEPHGAVGHDGDRALLAVGL